MVRVSLQHITHIGSYVYFLFEYFPYLKAGGEKGAAKSKLGKIFEATAFNANNSGNQSAASIYRYARDTRGTMIIDEGESLAFKAEQTAAYQAILLNGYERTGSVLRIDTESGNRPEKIPTYCPKIICSIGSMIETLEDRAFELILLKTLNKTIGNREVHQASKEWVPIRNSLYLCLMNHWKEVQKLESEITNEVDFPGRLWSISKPLLVLARFIYSYAGTREKVEPKIIEFIRQQQKEKQSKVNFSLAGSLLEALGTVLAQKGQLGQEGDLYPWRIDVSEVLNVVRQIEGDPIDPKTGKHYISAKRIAGILRNLHLYTDPKRAKDGYSFEISIQQVSDARQRLGVQSTQKKDDNSNGGEHGEHNERDEHGKGPPSTSEQKKGKAETDEQSGQGGLNKVHQVHQVHHVHQIVKAKSQKPRGRLMPTLKQG